MKSLIRYLFILVEIVIAGNSLARPIYPPQDEHRQSSTTAGAISTTDYVPYETVAVHNVGKLATTVTNYGVFGSGSNTPLIDPLTGQQAPSLEYPQNKSVNYLYQMQLWIGALVGKDTLVSTGGGDSYAVPREFWPDSFPSGDIVYRSINDPHAPEFDSAISQQDFVAYYMDTIIDRSYTQHDHYTDRYHQSIGVKVTQRSYAWGYDYAEDFILVDLDIANITFRDINNVYIGLYSDNDVGKTTHGSYGGDDWVGFKKTTPSKYIAGLVDTINCAWAADNDGEPDPVSGQFQGLNSPTSIAAVSILRTPGGNNDFNFNWWAASWYQGYNWGPRKASADGFSVHTFFGDLGSPHSDGDKYYVMASDEFDYDSWESMYDHTYQGWLPPPEPSWGIQSGADIHYVVACGPYRIAPGQSLPLTFAMVMGQNFHRDGVIAPFPTRNFSDLELNALWASWVYDNPGVDTDGDGYRGECHVYGIGGSSAKPVPYDPSEPISEYDYVDTLWYRGDGVPDFSGAAPPPAPEFTLEAWINDNNQGIIDVYWDGMTTENTRDQFNQSIDFEGYRVYLSITGTAGDFDLVSSYDMDNYDRWEYDDDYEEWGIVYAPFSRAQLQGWYGENFDPDKFYDIDNLFPFYNIRTGQDDFFFFTRHDWNQSSLTDTTLIHKLYPLEPPPPTLDFDSARIYYPDVLTEDGKFKYYQYHYRLRRLLPSQPYYISVTAFDHGDPAKNLTPRETAPHTNALREFAQNSATKVEAEKLNVVVYPNPYRIDGGYREHFEGWEEPDLPAERTRAIHFANLPHKCAIRIFSIDGDLIREIFHDYPQGAPGSSHDQWDLISRNTMTVMSGIYYYTVDSDLGRQIGKLVIIK